MTTSEQALAASTAQPTGRARLVGIGMLIFGALCYGLNVPVARLANQQGVSGSESVLVRILLMIVLLLVICRPLKIPLRIAPKARPAIGALGVVSAVVSLAYMSSIAFIPVGVAAMVFYTFPIIVLLASPFIEGLRLTGLMLLAASIAFIGITLVIGPSFSNLDWRGIALAGTASVAAATQFFVGARAPGGGGLPMIFWMQIIMLPFALLSTMLFAREPFQHWQAGAIPMLLSATGGILGIFCQYFGLPRIGAALASLIFCLEPIVSTLCSGLVLGEILSPLQYCGGALVICGVAVSCMIPHPKAA